MQLSLQRTPRVVVATFLVGVFAVVITACSGQSGSPAAPSSALPGGGGLAAAPPLLACPVLIGATDPIPQGKVAYCHVAGPAQGNEANIIDLETSAHGYFGHFDRQGNPLAGHESDHCGACTGDEPPPPCDPKTEKCD